MYWTVRSRLRALVAAEAGMRIAGTILGKEQVRRENGLGIGKSREKRGYITHRTEQELQIGEGIGEREGEIGRETVESGTRPKKETQECGYVLLGNAGDSAR